MKIPIAFAILSTMMYAEIVEHHEHVGTTALKLNYETLDFKGSKQKNDGKRQSIEIDYQDAKHHLQVYVEHTDTQTKPHILQDLAVDKYTLKYQYAINKMESLSLSHSYTDDNLIDAVDNGKIYGLGYKYKALSVAQYFSDYENFNVYQTDIKLATKKHFSKFVLMGAIVGKYIHLPDRKSNNYTKKAKEDYFTVGLKLHGHYEGWHMSAGAYVGERIFAVMNDGLKVQHHAMAFEKSMMFGVGKKFGNLHTKLRYVQQVATEVPIDNSGVDVTNISLSLEYTF